VRLREQATGFAQTDLVKCAFSRRYSSVDGRDRAGLLSWSEGIVVREPLLSWSKGIRKTANEQRRDGMMISDESAKAAQELAKLGQQGLQTGEKLGGYFARTFREAVGHLAGAASDSAEGFRIRNRVAVIEKTRERLKRTNVLPDLARIADRHAVPLIAAIEMEDDDGLQDAWARYIARALDPSQSHVTVNRQIISVISNLEPSDLPILRRVFMTRLDVPVQEDVELRSTDFGLPDSALEYSLVRLLGLGLFSFGNSSTLGLSGDMRGSLPCRLEIETQTGAYRSTPLLMLLQQATD
jgi:hypothetical protein